MNKSNGDKMNHKVRGPYEAFFKRFFDIVISLTVLFFLGWLYLILVVLVRIKLGSPVLFKQERPGKNEKIFKLYKFRTMTDERDDEGNLLPDEKRLTSFGKFLRSTSLDEMPEMINILKGDMSLIGPRPLLVRYLPRYTKEQHRRHEVRPGLTGLAAAKGRNSIDWESKFKFDVEYVDNITFLMDLKIIFWTIKIVLKRDGISEEGQATMSEFVGYNSEN